MTTGKRSTLDPLEIIGAGLSHQTLNPLAVICNNVEVMEMFTGQLREEVSVSEAGEEILTQLEAMSLEILDAAQRVNRTIQSLRRLSNLGCNLFEQEVDLTALLCELFIPSEALQLELPEVAVVQADRRALTQIILNLVDNARAAAAAMVRIQVHLEGDLACLTVEDDGPGVPPQESALIFKPFYSSEDLQRKQGMGLCEAQLFAERMQGELKHEGGALFSLRLKLKADQPSAPLE